jgi:hypothetical protein
MKGSSFKVTNSTVMRITAATSAQPESTLLIMPREPMGLRESGDEKGVVFIKQPPSKSQR